MANNRIDNVVIKQKTTQGTIVTITGNSDGHLGRHAGWVGAYIANQGDKQLGRGELNGNGTVTFDTYPLAPGEYQIVIHELDENARLTNNQDWSNAYTIVIHR
ncbi:hypothetical protein ACYZTX_27705 [Pseudomonas sp. MDT1-17]